MLRAMTFKTRLIGSAPALIGAQPATSMMLRGPAVAFAPPDDSGAAPVADTGPLSLDDAISVLSAAEEADAAPEPDADNAATDEDEDPEAEEATADADADAGDEDTEIEASDQEAGEDDAPEDDPASDEAAEDETDEPAEPVVEPPTFWSAEEKAAFTKAPPEVQRIVAAKDAEYSRQVSLAKEEAATARREAGIIAEIGDKIGAELERARTVFQGKWDGVDWAQWAREAPQEAIAAKFEYDAEQAELQKLETAKAATEAEEHRQFIRAENAKLAEAIPDLADPAEGRSRKAELLNMLSEDGFSGDDLKWAGAKELRIAWEALQYRKLKAKAAANPPKTTTPKQEPAKATAAKPAPKPITASVKPTAAPPPRKSVIQRRNRDVVKRALDSGRRDDVLAALEAIGE